MQVSVKSFKSVINTLALAIVLVVGVVAVAQAELPMGASPEEITDSALAASVRGDWTAYVAMIDSADAERVFAEFKPALEVLLKDTSASFSQLFGEHDQDSVDAKLNVMTAQQFLEHVLVKLAESPQGGNPSLVGYDIIGSVHEGDSLCHVVSRREEVTFMGIAQQIETNEIGVTSLRKSHGQWRMLADAKLEKAGVMLGELAKMNLGNMFKMMEKMQEMQESMEASDTGETVTKE